MDILKVKVGNEWVNIPAIMGQRGVGIQSIVKAGTQGAIDTYTIIYEDGATSFFTVKNGITPQFSIGEVQDGAVAAASITGTAENPVLNLTLPNANVPTKVSELENDANYAVDANYVHTDNNYTTVEKEKLSGIAAGAEVNVNADWNAISGDAAILNKPTDVSAFTNDAGYLTTETDPTVPAWAKAAQKPTYTAAEVGAPTVAEMQQAIANVNTMNIHICAQGEYNSETGVPTIQNPDTQTFYLVPGGEGSNLFIEWAYVNSAWERFGSADVEVPVTDVQVNGVSILQGGVANIPKATSTSLGFVTASEVRGTSINSGGILSIVSATEDEVKSGLQTRKPIVPKSQHESTFYGLAKAAGDSTQSASSNAVGTYTTEAKAAIQQMLGVPSTTDVGIYATKADTVLDTTLSRGRKENSTVGSGSIAFGGGVEASGDFSQAAGWNAAAKGGYSHAEGADTQAIGVSSHAEGSYTITSFPATAAHAEGSSTQANGYAAHAEGEGTQADGYVSHAEGYYTIAKGYHTRASGQYNVVDNYAAWPEWESGKAYAVDDKVKRTTTNGAGEVTVNGLICRTANSDTNFTQSKWRIAAEGVYVDIIGNGSADNARSNAYALDWDGNGHFAGDVFVHANADSTGGDKLLTAADLPVESGSGIGSVQVRSFESSNVTYTPTASGLGAFAEGGNVVASGNFSHAEGQTTNATQHEAHAEGWGSTASGLASHAEGMGTMASNMSAHAEGNTTIASGQASHAEGSGQLAASFNIKSTDDPLIYTVNRPTQIGDKIRYQSVDYTITAANNTSPYSVTLSSSIGQILNAVSASYIAGGATGSYSHVEGNMTTASGLAAHAEGLHTIASSNYQHTEGQYNIKDSADTYAHIVGNGSMTTPSNAYALTWTGDGHYAGDVYVHSNADSTGGTKLATVSDIPNVPVQDVQVNGASVLSNGVASIPIASANDTLGLVKTNVNYGISVIPNGTIGIIAASSNEVKTGTSSNRTLTPSQQHTSIFYGLSKVAGVDLANETVTLGTYPETSKAAIKEMLGVQDGLKVVRLI